MKATTTRTTRATRTTSLARPATLSPGPEDRGQQDRGPQDSQYQDDDDGHDLVGAPALRWRSGTTRSNGSGVGISGRLMNGGGVESTRSGEKVQLSSASWSSARRQ